VARTADIKGSVVHVNTTGAADVSASVTAHSDMTVKHNDSVFIVDNNRCGPDLADVSDFSLVLTGKENPV